MNSSGAAIFSLRRSWNAARPTAISISPRGCGAIGGPGKKLKAANGWTGPWIWPQCPFTREPAPLSRWIPLRQYTAQSVTGPTVLRVYPGADGDFSLYDDDGQSLGYRDGSDLSVVWIHFHWNDNARELTLEPDGRMTKWPGPARNYSVELTGSSAPAKTVSFAGTRVEIKL